MDWRTELVSGSCAAFVSRLVIAPLDVLKIRLQVGGRQQQLRRTLRAMVEQEGWLSLWKGNLAAELMVVPYGALSFLSYQLCKDALTRAAALRSSDRGPGPAASSQWASLIPLLSGAAAGVCATVATYPLDLLRTRLAAQHSQRPAYAGLRDALRTIVARDGLRGLYAGLWATLVGIVPLMAVQFQAYETSKALFAAYNRRRTAERPHTGRGGEGAERSLSTAQQSCAGLLAGLVSKLLTMPLDVIKKRSQVHAFDFHTASRPAPSAHGTEREELCGVWRMGRRIVQEEGIVGLFRGSVPSLLKAGPNAAVIYLTYEFVKSQLQRRQARIGDGKARLPSE